MFARAVNLSFVFPALQNNLAYSLNLAFSLNVSEFYAGTNLFNLHNKTISSDYFHANRIKKWYCVNLLAVKRQAYFLVALFVFSSQANFVRVLEFFKFASLKVIGKCSNFIASAMYEPRIYGVATSPMKVFVLSSWSSLWKLVQISEHSGLHA